MCLLKGEMKIEEPQSNITVLSKITSFIEKQTPGAKLLLEVPKVGKTSRRTWQSVPTWQSITIGSLLSEQLLMAGNELE